jgi:hypothetical protein
MNPLHNIASSGAKNDVIVGKNEMTDEGRVNISISKRAYDALVKHANQITEPNPQTDKPFTIEEILDQEILLLFDNDWEEPKNQNLQNTGQGTNPVSG